MRQVPLLISLRGRRLRPRVRRLTCHLLSVTSNLENISDFDFVIIVIFVIIFIIVFTVIIVIIVAPIAPESFPFTSTPKFDANCVKAIPLFHNDFQKKIL